MRKYFTAAKAVFVWWLEGAKQIDPWSRRVTPPGFKRDAFRNVGRGGKFSKWETAKILWRVHLKNAEPVGEIDERCGMEWVDRGISERIRKAQGR